MRQRRNVKLRGKAYRRVAHAAGLRGATAWKTLRGGARSRLQCRAILPTLLIGFMESIY
jgi:hypothetical protein